MKRQSQGDKPASPSEPLWSKRLYARLPRREIAYVKFIIESCDNLAYLSVIDKYEAIVQIIFTHEQSNELLKLMHSLESETGLALLDFP